MTAPLVQALIDAAEELADLMDEVRAGHHTPDSFTTQPVRSALDALSSAPSADTVTLDLCPICRKRPACCGLLCHDPGCAPEAPAGEPWQEEAARVTERFLPPNGGTRAEERALAALAKHFRFRSCAAPAPVRAQEAVKHATWCERRYTDGAICNCAPSAPEEGTKP